MAALLSQGKIFYKHIYSKISKNKITFQTYFVYANKGRAKRL